MRTQWCRERIDAAAEHCELDPEAVREVKKAAGFCEDHPEFSDLPTSALRPLIRERSPAVREKAISSVRNAIESGKNPGDGRFTRKVTAAAVDRIITSARRDVARQEMRQAAAGVAADPDGVQLLHLDFLKEYARIPAGTVDLALTDPPYVQEWLGNYGAFAQAAAHVLKPGGWLLMYAGHIHLAEILEQTQPYLPQRWILALVHAGGARCIHGVGVHACFKPMLLLQKPPLTPAKRYFYDVIQGTGREKGLHDWQQGEDEMRPMVEALTDPGDLVLDPFMGSGTIPALARRLGRRVIGVDIDPECVTVARGRLAVEAPP